MSRMLPVGFFNATTLMFGNAVYMYLTVAFIQMLKAFTPVITMAGLFLASLEVCCVPVIRSTSVENCMYPISSKVEKRLCWSICGHSEVSLLY